MVQAVSGKMASEIARKVADHMIEGPEEMEIKMSSETFTKECDDNKNFMQSSVSSYTLAEDRSQLSRDVDAWMSAANNSTESTAVQGSRVPLVQRSVLVRSSSINSLWYALAVLLPFFSANTCSHWRCTPSMVINTAEFCFGHLIQVCARARTHISQLARDQIARELFATAMDIVLVIYAIGFLVLSLYQASVFG